MAPSSRGRGRGGGYTNPHKFIVEGQEVIITRSKRGKIKIKMEGVEYT